MCRMEDDDHRGHPLMATYRARRFDLGAEFLRDLDREARRQLGPAAIFIGEKIVENAKRIARAELVNNRPPSRRNKATTRGEPHYIDSFEVGAPDLSGGRVRVLVRNTSPVANLIEEGSAPHTIPGPGRFPIGTSSWGGGNYADPSGPRKNYGGDRPPVQHPGKPGGFRIIERAIDEERGKRRRIQMAIKASLRG